jgi:hypothetical protein
MATFRAVTASTLARLPTLLLVAVALFQLWLAHTEHLSAWSGGGFGMFSTADVWARRHLHAFEMAPGIRRELEVPEELREALRGALVLPSESRLRDFALQLAAATQPGDEPRDEVSVIVYAPRFDRRTLAPSAEPLRAVRFDLRGAMP